MCSARQITPEVPFFQSKACISSAASCLLPSTSPFHPPLLPRVVVLSIRAVESPVWSRMELTAFITPTERPPPLSGAWGRAVTFWCFVTVSGGLGHAAGGKQAENSPKMGSSAILCADALRQRGILCNCEMISRRGAD